MLFKVIGSEKCSAQYSRIFTAVLPETSGKEPGSVLGMTKQGLKIACGGGSMLRLDLIQPEGKKVMEATAFLAGHPISVE